MTSPVWRGPGSMPRVMCSTPHGITDDFTYRVLLRWTTVVMCSTPHGITDDFTLVWFREQFPHGTCSTPHGITDDFTALLQCFIFSRFPMIAYKDFTSLSLTKG